ncbi:hypothetical protein LBMAG13_17770 [Actinomycetes bacterium]|nr:hypothetical protein LBMAG13_17770 [Actinomycetes bacterium]
MTNCLAHSSGWQNWQLGQDTNASATPFAHYSGVWFEVTANDAQQRTFAATVEPDNTDAIAIADRE